MGKTIHQTEATACQPVGSILPEKLGIPSSTLLLLGEVSALLFQLEPPRSPGLRNNESVNPLGPFAEMVKKITRPLNNLDVGDGFAEDNSCWR